MSKNSLAQAYQALLENFKRSNKDRKEKLAKEAGQPSADAYKAFLEKKAGIVPQKEKKVTSKKSPKKELKITEVVKVLTTTPTLVSKPTIHNVHILDASGSMNSGDKIRVACDGINEEISLLKKDNTVDYTNTFVHFSGSNDYKIEQMLVPISQAKVVNMRGRDMTALNDAIGRTLDVLLTKVKNGEKVLIKIFTDGGENDSKLYQPTQVKKMIANCEDKGFTITFVGVKSDVQKAIANYNIREDNTLVHDNTRGGVIKSFAMSADATKTYASRVAKGEDVRGGFYKRKATNV
jgi:Mg-chelatase subunit ChlD